MRRARSTPHPARSTPARATSTPPPACSTPHRPPARPSGWTTSPDARSSEHVGGPVVGLDPVDEERRAGRVLQPQREDLPVGGRVVPTLGLLPGRERDHDEVAGELTRYEPPSRHSRTSSDFPSRSTGAGWTRTRHGSSRRAAKFAERG